MKIFLISITVVSSILMVIVILLQQGKGAGLGAAFGRGAQGGLFTATGKANFLTRMTSGLVTVFLLSALALSVFLGNNENQEVLQQLQGDSTEITANDEESVILGSDDDEEIMMTNDAESETMMSNDTESETMMANDSETNENKTPN